MHKLWGKAEIEIMKQLDHVSSLGDEVVLTEVYVIQDLLVKLTMEIWQFTLLHRFTHEVLFNIVVEIC